MTIFKDRLLGNYKIGVLSGYLYTILTLVASIFVTRHIFIFFDNSEYGVFILIVETIAVFEILDFGFSGGMMSFLSRETDNMVRINKLVSTLFYSQVGLAFISFIFSLSLVFNPSLLFENVDIEENQLKNAILIASVSLFLTMITKSISQIIYARRKIAGDNYLKIGTLILRVSLIFLFLEHYPTVEFLIFVTFVTQLVNLIKSIYLVRHIESDIDFRLSYFDLSVLKEVWKVSSWFAIGGLSIILNERFDNIMSGLLLNAESITILVITRKLFDIARIFIFQLNNNYRPYFGRLFGQGKQAEVVEKFKNISIISVFFASAVGGMIIIFNDLFIHFWVGGNKFGGLTLCFFLFINLVFHSWKISYRAFLSSNLIAKELAISSLIEGVLNVVLAYFLGLRFGLHGIVASTFVSGVLVQSVAFSMINNKYKFEKSIAMIIRNVEQFSLMFVSGLTSYFIFVMFESYFLKGFLWIFAMILLIMVVKKHYFNSYSVSDFVKLKML